MSSRSRASSARRNASHAYEPAGEASRRLGVSKSTLYAYVSRGMVRSRAVPGSRAHEYAIEDLESLVRRRAARRDPAAAAARNLGVDGFPVLESSLTLIEGGKLHYRGRDATQLARDVTIEEVAALLWQRPFSDELPLRATTSLRPRLASLGLISRFLTYLADAAPRDAASLHLTRPAAAKAGVRILRGLAAMATGGTPSATPVAQQLCAAWKLQPRRQRAIEAALILCADHELNVSAFAARCVASAEAGPYLVVAGALAALAGRRHGNNTARVAELFDATGAPRQVLEDRLRRGDDVPGFGHPLYPDGDPRAAALLELAPAGPVKRRVMAFVAAGEEMLGAAPTLDVGLVGLSRALALPPDAPLTLFALGRTVGWIAHAIEQYEAGVLIRPRAKYVGPRPA